MLFDTHVHLIYRDRLRYPWLDQKPALNHDSHLEDYLRQARQLAITDALHMEVDVHEGDMEAESELVAQLMEHEDGIVRGAIAACRPEREDFPAYLERAIARPHVKGFRRVLHVVADDVSGSETFRANVRRLGDVGMPFDVNVLSRQLPLAVELVDACPRVQFVLDHCGAPDIRNGAWQPWADDIVALAERPNVVGKISGVMAYGNGPAWRLDDLARYVEHTLEAFGWARVVWGSDSPVCTLGGPISAWVAAIQLIVGGASETEKAALFRDNARRIWRV